MAQDQGPDLPQLVRPYEPERIRVRFGKRPDQLLDIAWAESILMRLSSDYAQLFGRLLAEAMIGPEASTARRGRPPA